MCVILVVHKTRPTDDMVEQAFEANPAGGGVAWRENGFVHWQKGLNLDGMKALCARVPIPFIAHFRIPTEGGVRDELCHPFPIEKSAPLDLTGTTKGFVLFHNGHWADWRKWMFDTVRGRNIAFPEGKWSDTRAMAWSAAYYNRGILEVIGEKTVAFGPDALEISGTGWKVVDEILVSNDHWYWKGTGHHYTQTMCRERKCVRKDLVGSTGYCPMHQPEKKPETKLLEGETVTTAGRVHGGDPRELPFAQACKLFREGKLSKNKLKQARKQFERDMEKTARAKHQETQAILGPTRTIEILH